MEQKIGAVVGKAHKLKKSNYVRFDAIVSIILPGGKVYLFH